MVWDLSFCPYGTWVFNYQDFYKHCVPMGHKATLNIVCPKRAILIMISKVRETRTISIGTELNFRMGLSEKTGNSQ